MNIFTTIILAFSMSVDAFAVTLAKGIKMQQRPNLLATLRIATIFGVVEAITPIIGWYAGSIVNDFVGGFGQWMAFIILCLVGVSMIFNKHTNIEQSTEFKSAYNSMFSLIATAFATSIDAMAVGASLALVEINIWLISITIGCATFIMTTLGITLGNYVGLRIGKLAEVIGGICLIIIGYYIFSH